MRTNLILFAIASLFLLGSCKHYCRTNPYPTARLVNFDSAELDAVILNIYAPDGKFQSPQKTQIFSSRRTNSPDTSSLFTTYSYVTDIDTALFLDFSVDATIEIPALGVKHYIKGVSIHNDTWKDVNCTNSMSYFLDDVKYTNPMRIGAEYPGFIDIRK